MYFYVEKPSLKVTENCCKPRSSRIPGGSAIFYGKISDGRKTKFMISFDWNELLTYFFHQMKGNLIGILKNFMKKYFRVGTGSKSGHNRTWFEIYKNWFFAFHWYHLHNMDLIQQNMLERWDKINIRQIPGPWAFLWHSFGPNRVEIGSRSRF